MESIWSKTREQGAKRPALQGDVKADVVIIGGGLTGILTAKLLKDLGVRAVVLEAKNIGSGQTKNTTAKITSQHDLIYDRLITEFGRELAQQYAMANEEAILKYKSIIQRENIDCDFEEKRAYLYSTRESDIESLRKEYLAAKELGIKASYVDQTELPFLVEGAVVFEGQAQFHPLKFCIQSQRI